MFEEDEIEEPPLIPIEMNSMVEAIEDGETYRGMLVGERDYSYVVNVTHRNNVALVGGELNDLAGYEIPKRKVKKYNAQQAPQLKTVGPEGITITHFSDVGVVSSEHVVPQGNVVVTNHGLGSGVYGLANAGPSEQEAAIKYNPNAVAHDVTMRNPLYLQDAGHGGDFTAMSKELQRIVDKIHNEYGKPLKLSHYDGASDWMEGHQVETQNLQNLIRRVFSRVNDNRVPSVGELNNIISNFLVKYNTRDSSHATKQPVNYLMKFMGYDGVYADNSTDNSFSRGCVAYVGKNSNTPRTTNKGRM
jgi:hypothetical protein